MGRAADRVIQGLRLLIQCARASALIAMGTPTNERARRTLAADSLWAAPTTDEHDSAQAENSQAQQGVGRGIGDHSDRVEDHIIPARVEIVGRGQEPIDGEGLEIVGGEGS